MTTGRKILVLESDRAAAFPLGAGLRKNGWIVVSAPDAATAMSAARQQKPDAVLLSSRLAGGGGVVALRRLRSSVYTTLIPVIGIAPRESAERNALIESGAQEVLDPPGDAEAIDAALRRHLQREKTIPLVPPVVLREPERVKALEKSRMLDTPPDASLDRVTRLAAVLLGAPLGRLSIVDDKRQLFKSEIDRQGGPLKKETPLTHSICQWVAGGREEAVVNDARQNPVLRDNLAVREDGVIAYAGVPFSLDGIQVLGSFCVADYKPRIWSSPQIATLRDLGLVLRHYGDPHDDTTDPPVKIKTVGNALIAAGNVLVRDLPTCGHAERQELTGIIEDLGARLAKVAAIAPTAVA